MPGQADDRFRDIRESQDQASTSPWSEYRRLVLAELTRIDSVCENVKTGLNSEQMKMALMQDRLNDLKDNFDKRVDALERRVRTGSGSNGKPPGLIGNIAETLGITPGMLWMTVVLIAIVAPQFFDVILKLLPLPG